MNETLNHAISVFGFIIQGKGEKSGITFGNAIREAYDCKDNLKNKVLVEAIERHIVTIRYDYNGQIKLTYKP